MTNQIRPTSELFMNNNTIPTAATPDARQPDYHTPGVTYNAYRCNPHCTARPRLQTHPTVLKAGDQHPGSSHIPVMNTKMDCKPGSITLPSPSITWPFPSGTSCSSPSSTTFLAPSPTSVNDTAVLDAFVRQRQRISDLYDTASFTMPPYLAKQLAELEVMDEDAWTTKFPRDIDADSKLGAVQSLLVELGLVVVRLSEIVKGRVQGDVH